MRSSYLVRTSGLCLRRNRGELELTSDGWQARLPVSKEDAKCSARQREDAMTRYLFVLVLLATPNRIEAQVMASQSHLTHGPLSPESGQTTQATPDHPVSLPQNQPQSIQTSGSIDVLSIQEFSENDTNRLAVRVTTTEDAQVHCEVYQRSANSDILVASGDSYIAKQQSVSIKKG